MKEPTYYNKNGLSPLRAFKEGLLSEEEFVGFCKGNIIKYIVRCNQKSTDVTGDLDKAINYINWLKEYYTCLDEKIEETSNDTVDDTHTYDKDKIIKELQVWKDASTLNNIKWDLLK